MQVRILDEAGDVIWSQSPKIGMTAPSHREDGTLEKIIAALKSAEVLAEQEMGLPADESWQLPRQ